MSRGGLRRASPGPGRGYLFVAPFLVVFVAMLVVPLAYAGYLSLFREQLIGGSASPGWTTTSGAAVTER